MGKEVGGLSKWFPMFEVFKGTPKGSKSVLGAPILKTTQVN